MIPSRLIIRSKLGRTVLARAVETIGPRYMRDGDRHSRVKRYIVMRGETCVLVGVDRMQRVYLLGGFTDYDMVAEKWIRNGHYHHYADPKFIGHLQEMV